MNAMSLAIAARRRASLDFLPNGARTPLAAPPPPPAPPSPPAAVLAMAAGLAAGRAGLLGGVAGLVPALSWLTLGFGVPVTYLAGVLAVTAAAARKLRPGVLARLPIVLATMHVCWGVGFPTSPRSLMPGHRR